GILRASCAQSTCGTWTTASLVSFSSRRPVTQRRSRGAGTQSTWWRSREKAQGRNAHYKLMSTVMLWLQKIKADSGSIIS
ncbi:hypothetical protein GBAR_LOCUS8629, partial [Geodia barretti]